MNRVPLLLSGQSFEIVDGTALWWPAQRALFVADLHFEKASWFALRGQMLPPYDSLATLSRLSLIAQTLEAERIYCLGDNFHDDAGTERLPEQAQAIVTHLADHHDLSWITGNHDPGLGDALPGAVHPALTVGPLVLRHEAHADADSLCSGIELSGHYHPKARIRAGGRIISRPCFVAGALKEGGGGDAARLILPAFGALTGGLDVGADVIARLFPNGYRALVPAAARLLSFEFSVAETVSKAQFSLWHK